MRTQEEIVKYYQDRRDFDFTGAIMEAVLPFLDYKHAKQFFKPDNDMTAEEWKSEIQEDYTRENLLNKLERYTAFGWEKALNHRGISTWRTYEKIKAYLWLLEDDELFNFATNVGNYDLYGAPLLAEVCKKYGFPMPIDERARRMAMGLPCREGCIEGCDG